MSKVIVITGAGAGLGRALARRFGADGEQVVLLGRTLSKVEAVATELGASAMAVQCDVSSPDSVRAAFEVISKRHPVIDVLINNAVYYQPFLVAEATDEQLLTTFNTNTLGPVLCSRAAIPLLRPGSHIINVSSESVAMLFPHLVTYQASKAGLERFSEGLRHELEADGIRVTVVRAGSMYEEGRVWEVDPEARKRFAMAAIDAGIKLMDRAVSQFDSVANVFRLLIDLPVDLHTGLISLEARKPH